MIYDDKLFVNLDGKLFSGVVSGSYTSKHYNIHAV